MERFERHDTLEGFTIKCNKCGNEQVVTRENVGHFVNEYDWPAKTSDFQLPSDMKMGAFISYDTCNATVMCECGNKITEVR